MVAAPYEMFNMGNKTHPQQPDIGNINLYVLKKTPKHFRAYGRKKIHFKSKTFNSKTMKPN